MRAVLLAAVAACCLASEARASFTYTLVNPVYSDYTNSVGARLNLSFTVSDAAVNRGSFSLQGQGSGSRDLVYIGDLADFISFYANSAVSPAYLYGRLSLSATFDNTGPVTSFYENYYGDTETSSVSGSSTQLSGAFGSDNFGGRCGSSDCSLLSGQFAQSFTQVPEPVSLSILATGLLAGIVVRRRV